MTAIQLAALDYIDSVKSNVKKGVDQKLARLTLLIGPNGSGKTSVQNAIELGASGFASDLEGRAKVKKSDALSKLGPSTTTEALLVQLTTAKGRSGSWKLTPNKRGGFHEPVHERLGVDVVFPVQDVREVLSGSPDTVRMWLMGRVGMEVDENDIINKLPDDLQELYRGRASMIRKPHLTEVDVLLELIETTEKEARATDAEVRTIKQTSESMMEGLENEPTIAELQEAERAATTAHDAYCAAQDVYSKQTIRPDLKGMLRDAELATAEFSKANQALLALPSPTLNENETKIIRLRELISELSNVTIQIASPKCLICQSPIAIDLPERVKKLDADNQAGREAIAAQARRLKDEQVVQHLKNLAVKATQRYIKAEAEEKNFKAVELPDMKALSDASMRALEHNAALKQRQRTWANARNVRDQIRRTTAIAAQLKDLAAACSAVVNDLLNGAAKKFEVAVQSHLPPEDKFALVLIEGKKSVCRMGFRRGNMLHTALSGAEWARLTLALGCATYKPSEDTLAIFIPEERAFDPETLRDVMKALSNAPGQVILQSPHGPAGNDHGEWKINVLAPPPESTPAAAPSLAAA